MLSALTGSPWRLALDLALGGVVVLFVATQVLLLLYASHRALTLLRVWRATRPSRPPSPDALDRERPGSQPHVWPVVTVQLPVYNERVVVERAIEAAAALHYPAGRLEIQVLDDSTDETTAIAATVVARLRAAGHDVALLHRDARDGFKAGALAAGLLRARGELIAVFDADFVPPPRFLEQMVPRFADAGIGMVQARWGHLNRDGSRLTAAQACLLDAHFLLDHVARSEHGLFMNFNGTAGVWRRTCIEDAGGWAHDTLTEDLDLSYRAQQRGWRFAIAPEVVVPAELPADLAALRTQQHRWAKGSIQTARKLLPGLLRAGLPARVRLEAAVHLTVNAGYPITLLAALLLGPALWIARDVPAWIASSGVAWTGVVSGGVFLAAGQRRAGRSWRSIARDVPMAMVLAAGLSLIHTRAVLEGLGRGLGDWRRTPKSGDGAPRSRARPYRPLALSNAGERMLALYFTALGVAIAATISTWTAALSLVALMAVGFAYVGFRAGRSPSALDSSGGVRSA